MAERPTSCEPDDEFQWSECPKCGGLALFWAQDRIEHGYVQHYSYIECGSCGLEEPDWRQGEMVYEEP
jgi:hypothetical protein